MPATFPVARASVSEDPQRKAARWRTSYAASAASMLAREDKSTPARAAAAFAAGVLRSGATNDLGWMRRSAAAYALCWRASRSAEAAAVALRPADIRSAEPVT